ncbi:MAG TPA: glycosyltransferase family 4 protein [Chloroflexia bacterium]|nr:glycosyltransferase family 4 protein [Chloroflexia bacterium]
MSARMMPLARALAARGHGVHVVVPPWDDPQAVPGTSFESLGDGDAGGWVRVETLRLPERGLSSLRLTNGMLLAALKNRGAVAGGPKGHEHFKDRGPDVVHVFKPVGYSGLSALALSALQVPWVLDVDDWEGPGGWADVNPYSPAQKLSITVMEALLPRLAGAVTAASRTLEARTWDMGLPRRRVFYLPNGVSRAKYANWHPTPKISLYPQESADERRPTLLLYSRLAEFPWRWPLEVLARVRRGHPDARLLVVGSGFFGEEKQLQAEAAATDLGESVTVLGRVPEELLPAALSVGDVALYPMDDTLLNRAKSPVKLLEPMLMGLPIVAHRVGQTPEFLGDTGVLVEAGDLEAMSEAAAALLSDAERRGRLGEKARQRVWAEFNWERLSGVAERAYQAAFRRLAPPAAG